MNPANKTRMADEMVGSANEVRTSVHINGIVRATDESFPSCQAVASRESDLLLIPTKTLNTNKVKEVIDEASKENLRITSATLAENIVLALNASNSLNPAWVSCCIQQIEQRLT